MKSGRRSRNKYFDKTFKVGQTVYTVNAADNTVDTWKYSGGLPVDGEFLCQLVNGKKSCFLPKRCVYGTEAEALAIAKDK